MTSSPSGGRRRSSGATAPRLAASRQCRSAGERPGTGRQKRQSPPPTPRTAQLSERHLLSSDCWEADELLGVDDRRVEPGPHTVVQEHRGEHLAAGRWEPERDVGDSEQGMGVREALLDEPTPRTVSAAAPAKRASPLAAGNTRGSTSTSAGGMPHSPRRASSRVATSSLRSAVRAMPSLGCSSMHPATTAAPNRLARRATSSSRIPPSSRLTELIAGRPGISSRARAITAGSVESMTSGTRTARRSALSVPSVSSPSSASGSARQTSRTWAPPRTCRRPISAASANRPDRASSRNLFEPSALVRSPMSNGAGDWRISTASHPASRAGGVAPAGR